MSSVVLDDSVARLNAAFPLAERLSELPPPVRDVHRSILDAFLASGRPPHASAWDVAAVDALVGADAIVIKGDEIRGAYPFSAEDTGHVVSPVGGPSVGAMCALDALAIGPLFEVSTVIASACAHTGMSLEVRMDGPVSSVPPDVHVGIHFQDPSLCAASSLCREMVFLADAAAADAWRERAPGERETYTLDEAVTFAVRFFAPIVS